MGQRFFHKRLEVGFHLDLVEDKGIYLLKALTCMNFFLYEKMLFIKEMDTFSHIVVGTIYTTHIDHFTPQRSAFEQSAACLSVF